MGQISSARLQKFERAYRLDVASHLARLAQTGKTTTYGALSQQFGGIARGWGDTLSGIALRCHKHGYPLLSVLVVSADTGLPSVDADLYRYLGVEDAEALKAEQQVCFGFDWSVTPLWG
jgi:hypothetical protein